MSPRKSRHIGGFVDYGGASGWPKISVVYGYGGGRVVYGHGGGGRVVYGGGRWRRVSGRDHGTAPSPRALWSPLIGPRTHHQWGTHCQHTAGDTAQYIMVEPEYWSQISSCRNKNNNLTSIIVCEADL